MKIFPAADLFPMLPDDELQQLAADIKENGLRDPIVLATVNGEEMLVDGRNRLAACKLAEVEPTVRRLNGEDPTAFVVSVNINRRHMTKGQRAMAVAMIYPEPAKGGRGKRSQNWEGIGSTKTAQNLLSQARTVLAHTPQLAQQVLAGLPLHEAYTTAMAIKAEGESDTAKLDRLRSDAPHFAELIDLGKMTLGQAAAAHAQQLIEEAEAEENRRETFLRVAAAACSVDSFANSDFIAGLEQRLADEVFCKAFHSRVRPQNYEDIHRLVEGAKVLGRLLKMVGNKGGLDVDDDV
jgi:hypothetical protein